MIILYGATIWARVTLDSDIFYNKPDKWFKIWFYIVLRVWHKDHKTEMRGERFLKYEWIMEGCKATRSEVDHCIRWMKKSQMLATRKATGGFVVKVLHYGLYQDLDNYKSDGIGETKAKQKRNKSDTHIKKNVNKDIKQDISKDMEQDIKENLEKETKKKKILLAQFETFWNLFDYKIGKDDCVAYWVNGRKLKNGKKMNDEMRRLAMEAVPKYVANTYKTEYPTRKHPKTWIYGSCWEDEVTIKEDDYEGENRPRIVNIPGREMAYDR